MRAKERENLVVSERASVETEKLQDGQMRLVSGKCGCQDLEKLHTAQQMSKWTEERGDGKADRNLGSPLINQVTDLSW